MMGALLSVNANTQLELVTFILYSIFIHLLFLSMYIWLEIKCEEQHHTPIQFRDSCSV